jgi:hypothetical protein
MGLINSDLFIVERSGVQYKMTADAIADFVGAVRDYTTATITSRNLLTGLNVGDRVFVTDASGDATVTSGWAVYRVQSVGPIVYAKIQEQESMDLVITATTNLGYTAGAASGIITNDNGTNATIPLADSINAGLMPPAMFTASHDAATAGLTAATNPVNITTGQVLTFGVTQLTTLP